jgi:hypothetical protein
MNKADLFAVLPSDFNQSSAPTSQREAFVSSPDSAFFLICLTLRLVDCFSAENKALESRQLALFSLRRQPRNSKSCI